MKRQSAGLDKGSTMFLRLVVILLGLMVLGGCAIALPAGILSDTTGYYKPILVGMYAPAIPFFIALHQTLKLLGYIDRNEVFSQAAVMALKNIKYCALAISALYIAGMPYIYYAADKDDAPGVMAIGLVLAGAPFVIGTAAAVFQRLLQNAVDIKSENDLTV